jgi:galactokinase/mevalonate kinase-like predicted kinase
LTNSWSDKERAIKKILYEQEADAFLLAANIDKALVMLIKKIFNESTWADLNMGAAIGSSSLRNRHSVRQIRMHLETKFNKHRPVNIQSIGEVPLEPVFF